MLCLVLLSFSCRDELTMPDYGKIAINVTHTIDGLPLEIDSAQYECAAGFSYSISCLEYYVSNVTFVGDHGNSYIDNGIYYINAADPNHCDFEIDRVPVGSYSRITLNIGIDSARNLTGYLPNTLQNVNMAWPVGMGGGYHFMKMEGHYISTSVFGYAVHLGSNQSLTFCSIDEPTSFVYTNHSGVLTMDINQWFQDPYIYNFDTDGNYTMGNASLMELISVNGRDVMSFSQTQ